MQQKIDFGFSLPLTNVTKRVGGVSGGLILTTVLTILLILIFDYTSTTTYWLLKSNKAQMCLQIL